MRGNRFDGSKLYGQPIVCWYHESWRAAHQKGHLKPHGIQLNGLFSVPAPSFRLSRERRGFLFYTSLAALILRESGEEREILPHQPNHALYAKFGFRGYRVSCSFMPARRRVALYDGRHRLVEVRRGCPVFSRRALRSGSCEGTCAVLRNFGGMRAVAFAEVPMDTPWLFAATTARGPPNLRPRQRVALQILCLYDSA